MRYLIIITFLYVTQFAKSQDTIKTYFDSNWDEVSKEKATYYRVAAKGDKKLWIVKDYYLNGQLQMVGNFQSKKLKNREGHFTYYYENGLKDSEGDYLNGNRVGEWKWYFENGQISSKETYSNNELIDIQCWNENSEKQIENCKTEIQPEFIGGLEALMKFLNENLIYPKEAQNANIKGVVNIRFAVGKDGTVGEAEVIKSVHPLLDNEALRVVNIMLLPKNWTGN
jgi:TonB family protein